MWWCVAWIGAALAQAVEVAYPAPEAGALARVDLYPPPDEGPRKLAVFVHGGSWVGGDKANLSRAASLVPWLESLGYAVAAPNFRRASGPGQPGGVGAVQQAEDIARAVVWLDAHRAQTGATEPGILLVGYSSGAHLVALLAADPTYLEAAGGAHSAVEASISLDVHAFDVPYALSLMEGSTIAKNIPLITAVFGETEAEQRRGSPAHCLGKETPPALLISADPSATKGSKGAIARAANERYAAVLAAAGVTVQHAHYDGETHGSLVLDLGAEGDAPTEAVEAFLAGLPR